MNFKIKDWHYHNTILDYNAPFQKDSGFFFMPMSAATDLIITDNYSDMDCVLDVIILDIPITQQDYFYMENGVALQVWLRFVERFFW